MSRPVKNVSPSRPRAFARWVGLGAMNLGELATVARAHGMQIIQGYKPDMHFFYELALWGTPKQMKATEANWSAAKKKHEDGSVSQAGQILAKKPAATLGVNLQLPREKWVDKE